jgi:hypothetical protein
MTWVVTLLVIGVAVMAVGAVLSKAERVSSEDQTSRAALIAAAMIVPVVLLIAVAFAPLGYTVDDVGIVVNRMGPKVCILHDEISEIRRIGRGDLGFGLRLGGSGGFFGSFGRFWSKGVGHHRMYATNSRDLVYIERVDGTKVILSPFPADAFVAAVEEARG